MAFVALEKLHRLHDGYRQCFRVAGLNLLLFQEEGQIYLIDNQCPHAGSPLNHSTIRGQQLRCNQHGLVFDLISGRALQHNYQLNKYPIVYEGQSVGFYSR